MGVKKTSPWLDSVPDEKRFPVLEGKIKADVAVVGAGIAGVMTAWRLAQKGVEVVLLEKGHVAGGDTGFTTAFITRVPDTSSAKLLERYGSNFLKQVFQANTQAQQYLIKTITEEGIDCGFKGCRAFECAYSADEHLRAEWKAIGSADSRARFISGEEVRQLSGAKALEEAIVFEGEGRFDVRQFIFSLLKRPTAQAIKVFEESEVTEVTVGRRMVLKTKNGEVSAGKVIIAAGLPIRAFSELHRLFTPAVTFALAARYPKGAPFGDNTFFDTDEPYQYYRLLGDQIVVLGGADRLAGQSVEAGAPAPHQKLRTFLNKKFPGDFEVTNEWSGSMFYSEDGLPYLSEHPHYQGKVFIASGFGGNGMVQGTLAGLVLADLVAGTANQFTAVYSFSRTKAEIPKPERKPKDYWPVIRRILQAVLPIVFLVSFLLPGYVFFSLRGGLSFLEGANFKFGNLLLFPLAGLYAFFFVWAQVMLGSSMNPLRKVFQWVEKFHRAEGVFALLFALTHPTMLLIGVGPALYFSYKFVSPEMILFVWLGQFQLIAILVTVATALLMRTKWLRKHWHKIHYLNYAVFVSAWIHSWFLGSDVQTTGLKYLWYFFGVTFLLSAGGKLYRVIRPPKKKPRLGVKTFEKVATVDQVKEGQPFCADVRGKKVALFKMGENYFAIDNVCDHAGGPLCEGRLEGEVIECPWHGSKFNVTTGEVVGPPARNPQEKFEVRVTDKDIEVKV